VREFLYKLTKGIEKKDIPKDLNYLLNDLLKLKAVKQHKNFYKLNSDYRFGSLDISRSNTGFLEVISPKKVKDLLIEEKDLLNSSKGDLVLAKRVYSNFGRPKAKIVHIIKKKDNYQVVYTKNIHNKIVGINVKTGIQSTILASLKSLKKLPLKTVLKIDSTTSSIVEVLGVLDDPKVDEKISLALYDKKEKFSKQSELEAKSFGDFVDKSMYPNRVDLTHLPFCTIDPITAKDFDDAIYFDEKEYALYVAIADVSEYVFFQGSIDKEAKQRGFSIYFPHKSIPMLPRALSENICSLKPYEDRLTFTFKITIDPKTLEVKKEELLESIINSKRRFNYDEVDEILKTKKSYDEKDNDLVDFLLPLNEIAKKIRKKRLQKGFDFHTSDIRMELDSEQNLLKTYKEVETASHSLVEECMLLANKAAAKMYDFGIFRIHEPPSYDDIAKLLEQVAELGIDATFKPDIHSLITDIQKKAKVAGLQEEVDMLIIRAQKQARYSATNIGHFGLGFDKYTHFTSPIRRYSDLTLHRLLKCIIKKDHKLKEFLLKDIEPLCEKLSELERESDKVAYDFMDRKYARWAKENLDEIFEAVITSTHSMPIAKTIGKIEGARIHLLESSVEFLEEIDVRILGSDVATTKIIGDITQVEREGIK